MTADILLSKLEKVRQTGNATWTARCPAHPDKSPSLAIRELPDGRVLLHCFTGCPTADVLFAVGLEFADLFPERPLSVHASPAERRPFPAADLLRLLAHETEIVRLAAVAMLDAGDLVLSYDDHARLELAVTRIQGALSLAGGARS